MPPKKKVVVETGSPTMSTSAPADDAPKLGIDQFELPKSIVSRVAKASLPGPISLQKDVPLALVKGSSVFINYLASSAQDVATESNQKTINAAHVLEAVKALGWEDGPELVKLLKSELNAYRKIALAKKNVGISTTRSAPVGMEGVGKKRGRKSNAELAALAEAEATGKTSSAGDDQIEIEKDGGQDQMAGVTKIVDDGNGAKEEVYKDGEEEDDEIDEDEEEEEEDVEEEEEEQDVGLQDDDMGEASNED